MLYEINTRVWLTELSHSLGRPATLDDIPNAALDEFARLGFTWIWLLTVWQTGAAGQQVSRTRPEWRREFEETLPDLRDDDIAGSGFAITDYTVPTNLGGDTALARLRARLRQRGLHLMLDFVPNHTALDHPWTSTHPDFYITGNEQALAQTPQNYIRLAQGKIMAHGRDPYFPGWPDTLQLNYGNPALQNAMIDILLKIAGQCDGVRCDMAMLLLPDVFARTWGIAMQPFWPRAIERVSQRFPQFRFMAEVYWDLEPTLLQLGFHYAYDKRLYDRLRQLNAPTVREHLRAPLQYQEKLVRFLENHDEPRAAAVFPPGVHQAAATIAFLSPGLPFFHQGQLQGARTHVSVHLRRGPSEIRDDTIQHFYDRLLTVLRRPAVRQGRWQLLDCAPAWTGNSSSEAILAFAWTAPEERLLVCVNYAVQQSQCYVRIPYADLGGVDCRLQDLLSDARYDRDGDDLMTRGLYLDLPAWRVHVFTLSPNSPAGQRG